MIKTVVFDFDGVIVDSNHLKDNAFFQLFEGNAKIPRKLVAEVLARNAGTRFDILRDIFVRSGAREGEIARLVDENAARFDALVQKGIASRGLAEGAAETLADLQSRFCLYINSATPESALHATAKRLGITDYFKGIYGAPATKEENLRAILGREGITGKEAVVIGDGAGDLKSARACCAHFIAIASGFYEWGRDADFPVVSGIKEAGAALAKIA